MLSVGIIPYVSAWLALFVNLYPYLSPYQVITCLTSGLSFITTAIVPYHVFDATT